jgi:hypothetical protein
VLVAKQVSRRPSASVSLNWALVPQRRDLDLFVIDKASGELLNWMALSTDEHADLQPDRYVVHDSRYGRPTARAAAGADPRCQGGRVARPLGLHQRRRPVAIRA